MGNWIPIGWNEDVLSQAGETDFFISIILELFCAELENTCDICHFVLSEVLGAMSCYLCDFVNLKGFSKWTIIVSKIFNMYGSFLYVVGWAVIKILMRNCNFKILHI